MSFTFFCYLILYFSSTCLHIFLHLFSTKFFYQFCISFMNWIWFALQCSSIMFSSCLSYACSLPFLTCFPYFVSFILLLAFFFLLSPLCLVCRLENLELMSKHGADVWIQHNQRLEAMLTRFVYPTSSNVIFCSIPCQVHQSSVPLLYWNICFWLFLYYRLVSIKRSVNCIP